MSDGGAPTDRLWIERYARLVGVEWCCRRVWGATGVRLAPYVFVGVVWGVTNVVPRLLAPRRYGSLAFRNDPAALFVLGAVLGLVALLRLVRGRYRAVVDDLPEPTDPSDGDHTTLRRVLGLAGVPTSGRPTYDRVVSDRVVAAVLVLGWGFHATFVLIDPTPFSPLTTLYGPFLARVKMLILVPAVYYVVAAELVGTYFCVHLFLPAAIIVDDRIDFTDPMGFGGLRPVGVFVRNTTALYVVPLSVYVGFHRLALGTSPTDRFPLFVLVGGTLLGVVLFVMPVYLLHRHMVRHKVRRIEELATEVRSRGAPDDGAMFPETRPRDDTEYQSYTHDYIRLRTVRDMHESPVSVGIVVEILSILGVPTLVSVATDALRLLVG